MIEPTNAGFAALESRINYDEIEIDTGTGCVLFKRKGVALAQMEAGCLTPGSILHIAGINGHLTIELRP